MVGELRKRSPGVSANVIAVYRQVFHNARSSSSRERSPLSALAAAVAAAAAAAVAPAVAAVAAAAAAALLCRICIEEDALRLQEISEGPHPLRSLCSNTNPNLGFRV